MARNIPVARMSAEQRERKRLSNASYREHNRAKLAAAERARQARKRKPPRQRLSPEEAAARQKAQKQRWQTQHREEKNAHARQKRLDHGEEMRAADRQRRKEHPGERSAKRSAWNKTHPDKTRVASNKWKDANRDKSRAISNAWKAAHPGIRYPESDRASAQRRRARLANAPINDVTKEQQQAVIDTAHGVCAYCQFYTPGCKLCQKRAHKQLTVDHITALVNGGPHTLHNLVACCRSCNSKKQKAPSPGFVQPLLL